MFRVEYSDDNGATWQLWTNYMDREEADMAAAALRCEHGQARVLPAD
jgi:hypothetical protein